MSKGFNVNKIIMCITVLLSSTFVEANVINGDFQTGDLTGWVWTPTEFSEPNMRPIVDNYVFKVNPGTDIDHCFIVQENGSVLFLDQEEGGILSQSINLHAGVSYDVSIDIVSIGIQSVNNAHGGSIYLYIDDDLQWEWTISDIVGEGSIISTSYDGTYNANRSGQHDLKIFFMRTYRNSDNTPVVYHYLDGVSIIAGDTNNDGLVDIYDYHNFIDQLGGSPGFESADFDNNGFVDLEDFAILRDNCHSPEPSMIAILLLGSFIFKKKKS